MVRKVVDIRVTSQLFLVSVFGIVRLPFCLNDYQLLLERLVPSEQIVIVQKLSFYWFIRFSLDVQLSLQYLPSSV
jgi:hypothetical protein